MLGCIFIQAQENYKGINNNKEQKEKEENYFFPYSLNKNSHQDFVGSVSKTYGLWQYVLSLREALRVGNVRYVAVMNKHI